MLWPLTPTQSSSPTLTPSVSSCSLKPGKAELKTPCTGKLKTGNTGKLKTSNTVYVSQVNREFSKCGRAASVHQTDDHGPH